MEYNQRIKVLKVCHNYVKCLQINPGNLQGETESGYRLTTFQFSTVSMMEISNVRTHSSKTTVSLDT